MFHREELWLCGSLFLLLCQISLSHFRPLDKDNLSDDTVNICGTPAPAFVPV